MPVHSLQTAPLENHAAGCTFKLCECMLSCTVSDCTACAQQWWCWCRYVCRHIPWPCECMFSCTMLRTVYPTMCRYVCCTFRGSAARLNLETGAVMWQTFTVPDNGGKPDQFSGGAVWGSSPTIDVQRQQVRCGLSAVPSAACINVISRVLHISCLIGISVA